MIVLAGIAEESPVSLVAEALREMGATFCLFDQRSVTAADMTLEIADATGGGAIDGSLTIDGEAIRLGAITGLYLRVMDDQLLPNLATLHQDAPERRHSRRLHELLLEFADLAPGRVLNRPSDMASNQSKPFQAQMIRDSGLDIPETLLTNDPAAAREFIERLWEEDSGVIYKSTSGVRSIVQKVEPSDLARMERIRWCPTQFQRLVEGTDIRVHVVGQSALAASIVSDATDYRYAHRQTGVEPTIESIEIDGGLRARCLELSRRLRLPLAGIDLRRTRDDRHVCFEVNPSPAFSFYEQRAGLPIAAHIARYLAGEAD